MFALICCCFLWICFFGFGNESCQLGLILGGFVEFSAKCVEKGFVVCIRVGQKCASVRVVCVRGQVRISQMFLLLFAFFVLLWFSFFDTRNVFVLFL